MQTANHHRRHNTKRAKRLTTITGGKIDQSKSGQLINNLKQISVIKIATWSGRGPWIMDGLF
jgi:hypothetical protein